jgi:general secretion pathway protein E/type IV pilus assembly protein PilB
VPNRDELPADFPWDDLEQAGGKLYRPRGCRACRQTGYAGRLGIFELLLTTDAIRKHAHERAGTWAILKTALDEGMRTLRQDGWRKVVDGRTSPDEVNRVTRGDVVRR